MATKITDELKTYLKQSQPENHVQVVIELKPIEQNNQAPGLSRQEKMQHLKKAFDAELQPVAMEISNMGGNIIETAWLNQTINASLPANSIVSIAKLKEVQAIDLPRRLLKE